MSGQAVDGPGSREWVRERLVALLGVEDWTDHPACRELVDWLYTVTRNRARRLGLDAGAQFDVAQDAMTPLVRALHDSRARFASTDNPAAVLERVAARAVGEGRHRTRMCGLSGVPGNGQNWRAGYPRRIGGEAARRLLEDLPASEVVADTAVDDTAERVAEWVVATVGVQLTADARDGLVYVLDRLVAGVSRAALLRSGHSALGADPAMRHLGFTGRAAGAFGVWLLGRHDSHHNAPSVLDAAISCGPSPDLSVRRWRRDARRFGFAVPAVAASERRTA